MIHIVASHNIYDHLHNMNVMYFEPFKNVYQKGCVMMKLTPG
jgi:hypothetical protein